MDLPTILLAANVLVCTVYAASKVLDEKMFPTRTPNFTHIMSSPCFVDKSLIVKEFIEDKEDVVIITAPRLFGKSFNLQMVKQFLEIPITEDGKIITKKSQTNSYKLFKRTKLYKDERKFFKKHFGSYPIIHIDYGSLNDVSSFQDMLKKLRIIICSSYQEHKYLINIEKVWGEDITKDYFLHYIDPGLNEQLSEHKIEYGFLYLSKVLQKFYNKLPIVLIDDYDAVINGLVFEHHKDLPRIMNLFKSIHSLLFKQNIPIVQKVFCTGILQTSGAGLSPVDREMMDYSFLQNHRYATFYGMTDDEVTKMIRVFQLKKGKNDSLRNEIRKYCGGYNVLKRESNIYNTLAVLKYLKMKKFGKPNIHTFYWLQPAVTDTLVPLLYFRNVRKGLIKMLREKTVQLKTHFPFTKKDVFDLKSIVELQYNATFDHFLIVFKYFLQTGFLTYSNTKERANGTTDIPEYTVQIPNLEIERELKRMLYQSIIQQYGFDSHLMDLIKADLNDLSENNSNKTYYKNLFNNIKDFIIDSRYYPFVSNDVQNDLLALLNPSFDVFSRTDKDFNDNQNRFDVHFKNKHNVTIFVEGNMLRSKDKIAFDQLYNCTRNTIYNMIRRKYVDVLDEHDRERVVYLGICLGMARMYRTKLTSISYSHYLKSLDNLSVITVFPEKKMLM